MNYDLTACEQPEQERARRLPDVAGYFLTTGVVLAAFLVWAFASFGRLFPLIEYRQWSVPANISVIGTLFTLKSIAFSRSFGLFTDASLAIFFGHNVMLHNAFQICLLVASAALLSLTLRRLFPTAPSSLFGVALLIALFSTAIIDSLVWQATMLDKLCLFLTWLATYASMRISVGKLRVGTLVAANVGILSVVIAAYNSKESSFALVPSLLLLLIIRGIKDNWNIQSFLVSTRNALAILAIPIIYAAIHVTIVLHDRLFIDTVGRNHEMSGALDFHLYHYFIYLFNMEGAASQWHLWPSAPPSVLSTFQMGAIGATILLAVLVYKFAGKAVFAVWLWALLSFVMSVSVSLHAAGFPAYYLLVPQFYLATLLFVSGYGLWKLIANKPGHIALNAALALVSVAYLAGFTQTLPTYTRIARMSDNFTAALAQLTGRITPSTMPKRITFYWPQTETKAYMFLAPANNRQIAPFIEPSWPNDALAALDRSIRDEPYMVEPQPRPGPGEVSVVLGDELRPEAVVVGSR
jgi:hypothetical protein